MNCRPKMAPRLTFFIFTAPKKIDTEEKGKKIFETKKKNSQSNYSGLNPFPQLPPLRNPDHQLWSPPWKEHQPLNPCSPWQRVAMVQAVRAFQLIRNCRWKCRKVKYCGQVPDHPKKGFVYSKFWYNDAQESLHALWKTRVVFAKLNDLVISWSTVGKIENHQSSKIQNVLVLQLPKLDEG